MGHKNQLLTRKESFLKLVIKMNIKTKDPKFCSF